MVMDRPGSRIDGLRGALSLPLTPLQYIVSWPIEIIGKLGTTVSTHDALVKQNLDLKAEELLLKALLRSSMQVQGKVLIAELLATDTDPFVHQVVLNKGSRDNLFIGQPVLDANGVMGEVIQIGPLTSRVLLVNDPRSGIPVQVARNGIRAIAVGDSYTGKLRLVNIPQTADIKVGDVLITSGLGINYPEGYPVGQVSSVLKDPSLQFATLGVEPSAHLDRSREVLLVWPNRTLQMRATP
jgi:rod shape-determining protein MreC